MSVFACYYLVFFVKMVAEVNSEEVSGAGPHISMCDLLPDILAGEIEDMWWLQISF